MNKISFQHDVLPLKDKLYRLALRITLNPGDAEDEIVSIEAFSLTICRNLSLDSIKRHENKNHSLEDVGPERPDSAFNPYEEMLQNDRISLIKTFIDTLPEKQKSCMQLRDFEGKTYKEIAEVMQITEEQVKVNLFRARQTIKQKFKKVDDYGL